MQANGAIFIGHWNDSFFPAPGSYIKIEPNGNFVVGQMYKKGEEKKFRGTTYYTNGHTERSD